MHLPPPPTSNRGEPSQWILAIHLGLFLVLLAALGIVVIVRPFANERLTLLVTLVILASITVIGRFLIRERSAPIPVTSEIVP